MSATKTKPRAGRLRVSRGVGTGQGSNEANNTPSGTAAVAPTACPRWERCSAPICPLDADWRLRTHIENEPVCGLLLELAKDGGEATLRACVSGHVVDALVTLAPPIHAAHGPVRRACLRAAKAGSRLKAWREHLAPSDVAH